MVADALLDAWAVQWLSLGCQSRHLPNRGPCPPRSCQGAKWLSAMSQPALAPRLPRLPRQLGPFSGGLLALPLHGDFHGLILALLGLAKSFPLPPTTPHGTPGAAGRHQPKFFPVTLSTAGMTSLVCSCSRAIAAGDLSRLIVPPCPARGWPNRC